MFLMGLSLIRMVRSVENKTDRGTKEKLRTKEKIDFVFFTSSLSLRHVHLKHERLKAKAEGSTLLVYTGWSLVSDHLILYHSSLFAVE